jgi:hypothetical protein
MTTKKKRCKAYKPKPINRPMMAETHHSLALKLHTAVETLINRPSASAYNEMTKHVAILTDAVGHMRNSNDLSKDRDATANALRTAVLVLDQIWNRWTKTAKVIVMPLDAVSLRNAVGVLDGAIKEIPKNIFDGCVLQVNRDAFYQQQETA